MVKLLSNKVQNNLKANDDVINARSRGFDKTW